MIEILFSQQFLYAFLMVFACIDFGFLLRRKGLVGEEGKKTVKLLIWNFTLPCMAFSAFVQDFSIEDLKLGGTVMAFSLFFYLFFIFLGRVCFIRAGKDKATVASLMGAIGQLTLFTMPLISALGMERATFYCGIMTLVFRIVLYFVAYPMIASKEGGIGEVKKALLSPVMIAMFLGCILWVTQDLFVVGDVRVLRIDQSLPAVYSVVKLLSSMVCPLAMIMIGMILGETKLKDAFTDRLSWLSSLMRVCVCPLIVFGTVSLLPDLFDAQARVAMVLGFAAPSSVTLCAFCVSAEKEELLSSRAATLTVLLSLITFPLLFLLLA